MVFFKSPFISSILSCSTYFLPCTSTVLDQENSQSSTGRSSALNLGKFKEIGGCSLAAWRDPHHLELTHGAGLQLSVRSRSDPMVPLTTTRGTQQLCTGHFWGLPGLETWMCANLSVYSQLGRVPGEHQAALAHRSHRADTCQSGLAGGKSQSLTAP